MAQSNLSLSTDVQTLLSMANKDLSGWTAVFEANDVENAEDLMSLSAEQFREMFTDHGVDLTPGKLNCLTKLLRQIDHDFVAYDCVVPTRALVSEESAEKVKKKARTWSTKRSFHRRLVDKLRIVADGSKHGTSLPPFSKLVKELVGDEDFTEPQLNTQLYGIFYFQCVATSGVLTDNDLDILSRDFRKLFPVQCQSMNLPVRKKLCRLFGAKRNGQYPEECPFVDLPEWNEWRSSNYACARALACEFTFLC
jgi:hypothetical protein